MGYEYGHFVEKYLACATNDNCIIKRGLLNRYNQTLEESLEMIKSYKRLFRSHLKLIISKNHNIDVPQEIDSEKLNKIYEKSNFDWTNQDKFLEFRKWYSKDIRGN